MRAKTETRRQAILEAAAEVFLAPLNIGRALYLCPIPARFCICLPLRSLLAGDQRTGYESLPNRAAF